MRIVYEKGDKVIHIKNGTTHIIKHAYVGPGLNYEQKIAVEGSNRYIWARNYRPATLQIGGITYNPMLNDKTENIPDGFQIKKGEISEKEARIREIANERIKNGLAISMSEARRYAILILERAERSKTQ